MRRTAVRQAKIFLAALMLLGAGLFVALGTPAHVPSAGAAADPVIAAAGDIACDPQNQSFNNGNGNSSACQQAATYALLTRINPAAVLALGDTQYYCGGYQAYLGSYALSWGKLLAKTYPVVGNHEYLLSPGSGPEGGGTGCDSSNIGAAGYFKYFAHAAKEGTPGEGWYSLDVGKWHLIALNSNCGDAGGCQASSPQGRWLASDLASHGNQCLLAYWHIPLWSSGGRAEVNAAPMVQQLVSAHADVILNGHDHIYERFAPQNASGVADPKNGVREFIAGTGGANHTSIVSVAPNSEVRDATTFGVLKLTLHATSYDWSFVGTSGSSIDSGSQSCHNSQGPPPPTTTTAHTTTVVPTTTTAPTKTTVPAATAPTATAASPPADQPQTAAAPPASPRLRVHITAARSGLNVQQTEVLTIVVANDGAGESSDVRLQIKLSGGLRLLGTPSGGRCVAAPVVACSLEPIAAGGSATVLASIRGRLVGRQTFAASALNGSDGPSSDNSAALPVLVSRHPKTAGRTSRRPNCVVPRLLGLTKPQASRAARAAGCALRHVGFRKSRAARVGLVVTQGRRTGLTLPHGAGIDVVVGS